jgi:hypothetical protein
MRINRKQALFVSVTGAMLLTGSLLLFAPNQISSSAIWLYAISGFAAGCLSFLLRRKLSNTDMSGGQAMLISVCTLTVVVIGLVAGFAIPAIEIAKLCVSISALLVGATFAARSSGGSLN